MARGWESKNIESQQEEALKPRDERPALTPEERDRVQRRRATELALASKRVELANATSDAHRAYIQRAIAELELILNS